MSEKIINKVQALFDKAAATEHEGERDECLRLADKLMSKYAIDQATIEAGRIANGQAASLKVENVQLSSTGDCAEAIMTMTYQIGKLTGCQGIFVRTGKDIWNRKDETVPWTVRFFGFQSDLDYLERLHALLQFAILTEIDPRVDVTDSYDANVYRLHESGIKWERICAAMNAAETSTGVKAFENTPWPDGGRLKRAYKRECARLGVVSHAVMSSKGYRNTFVSSFSKAVIDRIAATRREAQAEAGSGTEIVLASKDAQVNAAFNSMYPKTKTMAKSSGGKFDGEAASRGRSAGQRADLGGTRIGGKSAKALA